MEDLYVQAERLGHTVLWYRFRKIESLAVRDASGRCTIGLDPGKLRSKADERVKLAHELGHCETGAFYSREVTAEGRSRREERANRWAVCRLVPYGALCEALEEGCRELWELAERFEVTETFLAAAVRYYREAKGLSFPGPPPDG